MNGVNAVCHVEVVLNYVWQANAFQLMLFVKSCRYNKNHAILSTAPLRHQVSYHQAQIYFNFKYCRLISLFFAIVYCLAVNISLINLYKGTVLPWIPRPNYSNTSYDYPLNNDAWIVCNGLQTCKTGPFQGQFCEDLSGRVLVGAESMTNDLVKLKEAVFPDHAHKHKHTGEHSYDVKYRSGPMHLGSNGGGASNNDAKKHDHNHVYTFQNGVKINFAHMDETDTMVTSFANDNCVTDDEDCGLTKSSDGNLYPRHMRVKFIFKCS